MFKELDELRELLPDDVSVSISMTNKFMTIDLFDGETKESFKIDDTKGLDLALFILRRSLSEGHK